METKELVLINRSGKRMPTTLRLPAGTPVGTALVLHGLAGWQDQSCVRSIAETLCVQGYTTVTFDAADGAKAPDASFASATTTGYVHDAEDVINYLKDTAWYREPLLVAGHSQGALVALRYARRHPRDVLRLIMIAPAVSWKTDAHVGMVTRIRLGKTSDAFKEKPTVTLFPKWILDYFSFDAMKDAPHVPAPTLVVSAQNDEFVADQKIHSALSSRFEKSTHVVVPNAKHEFLGSESVLADTIKQWLTSS